MPREYSDHPICRQVKCGGSVGSIGIASEKAGEVGWDGGMTGDCHCVGLHCKEPVSGVQGLMQLIEGRLEGVSGVVPMTLECVSAVDDIERRGGAQGYRGSIRVCLNNVLEVAKHSLR